MKGGINWKIRINVYTVLYMIQIISKDLLYSTESSTRYSVMAYFRRESNKELIYVYVWLIHFAIYLKLTQLRSNFFFQKRINKIHFVYYIYIYIHKIIK